MCFPCSKTNIIIFIYFFCMIFYSICMRLFTVKKLEFSARFSLIFVRNNNNNQVHAAGYDCTKSYFESNDILLEKNICMQLVILFPACTSSLLKVKLRCLVRDLATRGRQRLTPDSTCNAICQNFSEHVMRIWRNGLHIKAFQFCLVVYLYKTR